MPHQLGPLLKQINDRMKASADEGMAEKNLTLAQARVLGFLRFSGGHATQKDIENFLAVSHPTVVGIVNRLEKKEFVSCHVDQSDRRNKVVALTKKALELGEQIRADITRAEEQLINGFSPEEIKELTRLLSMLLRNISPMSGSETSADSGCAENEEKEEDL